MGGQIYALLLVKLQVMRHTMNAGKALAIVLGAVMLLGGAGISLGLAVGMYWLASAGLSELDPMLTLLAMDGVVLLYLFFWAWAMLLEIQRSEVIDLRKMLYLPVSLGMIFLLNFGISMLGLPLLFFVPALIGFVGGLASRSGLMALWILPLGLAFFLMVSAWAYYFRGILAILMENKRRRRLILTLLPMAFVLLAQTPNLVMQRFSSPKHSDERRQTMQRLEEFRTQDEAMTRIILGNALVPAGWLPLGAAYVLDGDAERAGLCFGGLSAATLLGLGVGYRSTLMHYTGKARAKKARRRGTRRSGAVLTGLRIPGLPEDTAAATLAAFLTFARHPNIRMMLLMPLCLGAFFIVFYGSEFGEDYMKQGGGFLPIFILVWPFLNFGFVMLNLFGVDRQSFRAMILLPTPRHRYLIAKNLALFPFVGGLSLVFVLFGSYQSGQTWQPATVCVLQVFQIYLLFCIVGNFMSILFPYRIHAETMRSQTNRPVIVLIGLLSALLVAVLMLPSAFCLMVDRMNAEHAYTALPLGVLCSLVFLGATGAAYAFSLRHAGDLLLELEQRVLDALLRDRE